MLMLRSLLVLFSLLVLTSLGFAQSPQMIPFQAPAVSRTHIAFVYAGEIWLVERAGGEARKLFTQAGEKTAPRFSPDGSQIAFALNVGDNFEVHVALAQGGEAKRLTWHPKDDYPVGWSGDGKQILFRSYRLRDGTEQLYSIAVQGGFETQLPFPLAWNGSLSPDGARIAYSPTNDPTVNWRNYRGGTSAPIWLANLSDSQIEPLPRDNSNDLFPMWVGDKIYFVSDRSGTANLHSYEVKTKKISQLTRFEKYDIRSASACNDAIVFVQNGALQLYDLQTNQARVVPVRVSGDFAETKPRTIKANRYIQTFNLSPNGSHAVFSARGEVFTLSDKGEARNLTNTSGVAERYAVWSPDGKWIAYFSDESGEYQLHLRSADGATEVRKLAIAKQPSFYSEPVWSPDSKKLAFYDKGSALWLVNLETGEQNAVRRLDQSAQPENEFLNKAFSPDSQWLAYTKNLPNWMKGVFLYSLATGKSYQVSDSRLHADSPVFDANGKYLYFTASENYGPRRVFGMSAFQFRTLATRYIHVAVLSADGVAPGNAEGANASGAKIDPENIERRVVRLPQPARDYTALLAGKAGVLFAFEVRSDGPPVIHKLDIAARRSERFYEGANNFALSADASKMLLAVRGSFALVSTDALPKADEGRLNLDKLEIQLNPRDEWRQIFNEAWRLMRDYFYDAHHHGQNLAALREHYTKYLPNVVTRNDLNAVFAEMFSHISVSHMQIGGGDIPSSGSSNVGLLGADYQMEQGRYRITRIYRGDNSAPMLNAPLTQPGVNVKTGDFLLAVDGQEIKAEENLYRYFQGKTGRPTQIKVAATADGATARTYSVIPLPGENSLRRFDWMEHNRRLVHELSGGKLAYIYLPDTGGTGYSLFLRDWYGQLDKQGVIIDERYNSGGAPADFFIETLKRMPLSYYAFREGADMPFPVAAIPGPRVMITNEFAGSGGDTLPWMFRQAGLGTIVGKRTWGGGIGGFVQMPGFVDGGRMLAPNRAFFNPQTGAFDIENHGVAPDVEVELTPALVRAGRDTQLEKAVQLALEQLKKNPPAIPKRPKPPTYK
jgi:tricorn protease